MLLFKMSYFAEPYDHSKNEIKVDLNLFNYATKSDLKKHNRCYYIKIC